MNDPNSKTVCVLAGDGIGPEVIGPAVSVLEQVADIAGFRVRTIRAAIGGEALDRFGDPLPDETLQICRTSDAVLLGAVGGPRWDSNPPNLRPEKGLLGIRKGLGLYGNLRPVRQLRPLLDCSTLKPEVVDGIDLIVVRELTGGLYFGEPRGISGEPGSEVGLNSMRYQRFEIERIARKAFDLARLRRRNLTSVDKANVLEVSRLWRQVVESIHSGYSDVTLSHQYVDNCAMQMVLRPSQFDVILTENTFGDILSDIGGVLTGSIGTLPSASVGDGPSLYEPVHGSAPDIVGKDLANPIGTIGCVAMMFEISFGRPDLARRITDAIDRVLAQGFRTRDLSRSGGTLVGTRAFADRVQEQIAKG
jgi:3-isopropylmalate dehydrogenase